jgi:hypothetical protein
VEGVCADAAAPRGCRVADGCSTVIGGFYVLFLLPNPRPAITDD